MTDSQARPAATEGPSAEHGPQSGAGPATGHRPQPGGAAADQKPEPARWRTGRAASLRAPSLRAPSLRAPSLRTPSLLVLALALVIVATGAGLLTYLVAKPAGPAAQVQRPSGIPASISTGLANLMELSPLPRDPAPAFTLTDQAGHTLSLAGFRGKAVVLEFMDPHCTDICPIVSQEFVDAYHDLGPLASKVVFVAVNVNQYHAAVADLAAYSRAHQLTAIPDWHFFTGTLPQLQAVWGNYHIDVQARNPNADVIHTSAVYFIDPQGRERFLASPMADHTKAGAAFLPVRQIAQWGHGIAALARGLAS